MKTNLKVLVIVLIATLTAGCAGMIMDAIVQSERSSDKTFFELTKTREAIPAGVGRVFLYRTEASTMSSLQYGIGLQKNIIYCNLDGKLIAMYWELFLFLDITPGKHKMMCFKGKEVQGILTFMVDSQTNYYIRVDAALEEDKKMESNFDNEDDDDEKLNVKLTPVLVASKTAIKELNDINEFIGDKTSAYIH